MDEVREYARTAEFDFAVYKDIGNVMADRFGAQLTTDTFVIDTSRVLPYHGYLEDSPNETRAKTQGLRRAIEAVLEGRLVAMPEGKAMGCGIRRVKPCQASGYPRLRIARPTGASRVEWVLDYE
jgi:hypothetical protein